MDLQEQESFLELLTEHIPQEYLVEHRWWTVDAWEKAMLERLGIKFLIHKNIPQLIYPWEEQTTYAFQPYDAVWDLSEIEKNELKEKLGDNSPCCYLFFDSGLEEQITDVLQINFVEDFLFSVGLSDIEYEYFKYSSLYFDGKQLPILLLAENSHQSIWSTGSDQPFFTTFPLLSLSNDEELSTIKDEIAFLEYTKNCFLPYYDPKDILYKPLEESFFHKGLVEYIDDLLKQLCQVCLYDKHYEHLRKWSWSKSRITAEEAAVKDDFTSLLFGVFDALDKIQQNPQFGGLSVVKDGRPTSLAAIIREQRKSWHYFYADALGGLDYEDHFMLFSGYAY